MGSCGSSGRSSSGYKNDVALRLSVFRRCPCLCWDVFSFVIFPLDFFKVKEEKEQMDCSCSPVYKLSVSFSTFSSPLTSPRPSPWPRELRAHLCIRDAILTARKYLRSDLPIKLSAPAGEAGFLRLLMSSAFLSFLRRVVRVCAGLPPASTKPQHLSLLLLLFFFSLFGPTLRLFFVDLNLLLFLRLQRMRRTAPSYCVCLLNSEMAITIIVVITMIIMMNFHVAAAI